MCLSSLMTEDEKKKYQRLIDRGWGWKCYCNNKGGLRSTHQGNKATCRVNRWLKEKDYRGSSYTTTLHPYTTASQRYSFGFHVLLTRKGARNWGGHIRKVKFKDVRAVGWQGSVFYKINPCIVVGKVLITKEKG